MLIVEVINIMHISNLYLLDVINGDGVRVSLFVSGCTIHCKGCFNQCAWDFNYGKKFTEKEEQQSPEQPALHRMYTVPFYGLQMLSVHIPEADSYTSG